VNNDAEQWPKRTGVAKNGPTPSWLQNIPDLALSMVCHQPQELVADSENGLFPTDTN
jgi:hypothetical protein